MIIDAVNMSKTRSSLLFCLKLVSIGYVLYDLLVQMEGTTAATLGDPPPKGLTRTSEHPVMWNGVYSSFVPTEVSLCALLMSLVHT